MAAAMAAAVKPSWPSRAPPSGRSMVSRTFPRDLAPEDSVADHRVKQHQREDDEAAPPEHERKTGLRRGGFVDGDDEGDHVGPERHCQRAECRHEDQYDHVKRAMIIVTQDAEREHRCRDRATHQKY